MSAMPKPADEGCVCTIFPYASLVGSLIWMCKTQPDISYAVSTLARYMHLHTEEHDTAALHVLGYLSKYPNLGLGWTVTKTKNTDPIHLMMYADSSYGDVPDSRQSSHGYLMMMNGKPVSFISKKTPGVTIGGTQEAEFIILSEASREALFLTQFLDEIELPHSSPVMIRGDCLGAIRLVKTNRVTQKSKHIDMKYMSVREHIGKEIIDVEHIDTSKNIADIMTKPLGAVLFNKFRESIVCAVGQ